MKFLFATLLVLFTSLSLYAQNPSEEQHFKNSLGLDVFPTLAFLFNGDVNYLELGYVRSLKKLDLRAKINLNQNLGSSGTILRRVALQPADNLLFTSGYQETSTVHLSLGVARRLKMGTLEYYYGVDGDLGFKSVRASAFITNEDTGEVPELFDTIDSNHHFIGVTPVFGANVPLMPRVILSVELGVPLVYTFGEFEFLTENFDIVTREISTRKAEFNKLLNDVRISFLF